MQACRNYRIVRGYRLALLCKQKICFKTICYDIPPCSDRADFRFGCICAVDDIAGCFGHNIAATANCSQAGSRKFVREHCDLYYKLATALGGVRQ